MYKLILLDFSMPLCDGPSTTRAIRALLSKHNESACHTPLICIVTAYQEKVKKEAAQHSGADQFIVKPVFKDHLQRLLVRSGLIIL
mmetsp:Transcript_38017/g.49929  ORF Transcript_38017/g.49929 Transcript_38017/m.49929 type:complete len:86 (-) Transcript_38017:39-296(-)